MNHTTTPDTDENASQRIITQMQIEHAVAAVAKRIKNTIHDKNVLALIVMNGGLFYAADLLRKLPPSYAMASIKVSSYGNSTHSSGILTWESPLPPVRGRTVLVIDDICDSGLTLHTVKEHILQEGAAAVYTTTAFACNRDSASDFPAMYAPPGFLIGYGMDKAGSRRNLPYVIVEK